MDGKVFNRIEKKYLITKADKRDLMKLVNKNMRKDSYHKSEVINLYFDNDNYDLITDSIDWTDFKHKIRARCYGGYDRVFLEIKTKIRPPRNRPKGMEDEGIEDNIGYKRRVMITRSDFDELVQHQTSLTELAARSKETNHDLQIAKEIDYMLDHFHLEPKILITYQRESYKNEHDLRITFDERLRFRTQNLSFDKAKHGKIYFKDNHNIIMEVKAGGAIPLWLVKKMSERRIYPQQFSKIGKIYERIKNV